MLTVKRSARDLLRLIQTQADGGQGLESTFKPSNRSACSRDTLHTLPIPWKQNQDAYQPRYVFGYAMEAATFRAIFYGPYGHLNNPSGASMPGKEIE